MGAVDTPQREPKQKKGKKGGKIKRPKKRIGVKIDMTPMVDIAFLLLIFYMVTTVFSMPQSMELNLPPKPTEDDPPPVPVAKSRLMEVMVDASGNIFWLHTPKGQPDMELPELVSYNRFRNFMMDKIAEEPKMVIVLRIDPECRYEMMVGIIDDLQMIEREFKAQDPNWSLRFSLQDMTQWEFELMERAKAQIGLGGSEEGGTS